MANPLKEKLIDRLKALQAQRNEKAGEFAAAIARYDDQITAIRDLAQAWDTLTLDQAILALEKVGISFDIKT